MRHRLALTLLAALALAAPVAAQTTYTYTGNQYDFVSGPPYTTAMSITGSFLVVAPLAPNATTDVSGAVLAFSFNDGVETRTDADSLVCLFQVTTNGAGEIVLWDIVLRQDMVPAMTPQHGIDTRNVPSPGAVVDNAGFSPTDVGCGATAYDPSAQAIDNPGIWTSSSVMVPPATPVPSASTVGLGILMLLLAGFGAWRLTPRG